MFLWGDPMVRKNYGHGLVDEIIQPSSLLEVGSNLEGSAIIS